MFHRQQVANKAFRYLAEEQRFSATSLPRLWPGVNIINQVHFRAGNSSNKLQLTIAPIQAYMLASKGAPTFSEDVLLPGFSKHNNHYFIAACSQHTSKSLRFIKCKLKWATRSLRNAMQPLSAKYGGIRLKLTP
jgi:hypothetical protein